MLKKQKVNDTLNEAIISNNSTIDDHKIFNEGTFNNKIVQQTSDIGQI